MRRERLILIWVVDALNVNARKQRVCVCVYLYVYLYIESENFNILRVFFPFCFLY